MRKLLLLLTFIPSILLGQMSGPTSTDVANGEGAAGLVWLGSPSNPNLAINDVEVNDTIVFGIKLTNWLTSTDSITYAHIDVEYNKNAYTYLGSTYLAPSSDNPQNSEFEMTGYKMTWNNNYEAYSIWDQWQNSSYGTNADWNNIHLQTQTTSGDLGTLDYYTTIKFKVKDAGENHDYTDNIMVTMGRIASDKTDGTSKIYSPVYAYEKQDFSYEPLEDIDVQGIIAKLVMGNNIDLSKFKLTPVKKNSDGTWSAIISGNTSWLDVPSDGGVDITQYITSVNDDYAVVWTYQLPIDDGTNDFKTLYEDILTVSDVQLALKELATHGAGAINAGISKFNADVAGGTDGSSDNQLTSADTYKLLAHVMGVSELYTDLDEDGDIDADDANNSGGYFFRTTDGTTYTTTTAESYDANGITHTGLLTEIDVNFSNTTSGQTFEFYGTWKGDVNLSHSPDVSNTIANNTTSISSAPPVNYSGISNISSFDGVSGAQFAINGTMIVEEQADKVIATVVIPEGDLSASQIRLNFDNSRLEFTSVKTDSGNTSTNFAKLIDNRINFGSINTLGEKLTEVTYTVTFTKKTTINGVTGLVVLTATDAADINANRVQLKIQ